LSDQAAVSSLLRVLPTTCTRHTFTGTDASFALRRTMVLLFPICREMVWV
jgi:hypothetical protein